MPFHFGPFCVDAGARQVLKDGRAIHVTRKELDLLLLLLAERPNVVTKEQIYARLWPNVFVSEASLQALVSDLREILHSGDDRDEFIRTVHGIGYAFCGAVRDSGALPPMEQAVIRGWLVGATGRVSLHTGENIVGRSDHADLDTTTISRRHVRIQIEAESVSIEDLGSKNGTWLNDHPVTARTEISDGDTVRLGTSVFTFRRARMSSSTQSSLKPAEAPMRPPRRTPDAKSIRKTPG
jgi:DNA-binding winged helix-turn-helix (wHTH) protein